MNRTPLPAEPFAHQAGERAPIRCVSPGRRWARLLSQLPAGSADQSGERAVGPSRNGGIGRACGETGFLFTQIPIVRNRTESETVPAGAV